jgi:RNase adapter protein RapZ
VSDRPVPAAARQPVVLVSGLSGAGKASILRALEDLGFEAVDNPPLELIEELVARAEPGSARRLAVGVDARTRGFDADAVLATLARLRQNPGLRPELVFAWADEPALLRRFTETRRRHPLAPNGRVIDGLVAERALTAALQEAADLVVDTTDLPLAALRRLIERRYGAEATAGEQGGLSVALVSFAFPAGLPREADMVFDARFLRNPHYVSALKPRTGLDPEVGAYIEADPDYAAFLGHLVDLLSLLLPRFVQEGKKYVTITIGCTGGRHRSVHIVERLASRLTETGWRVTTTHRELAREGTLAPSAPDSTTPPRTGASGAAGVRSAQAQEA